MITFYDQLLDLFMSNHKIFIHNIRIYSFIYTIKYYSYTNTGHSIHNVLWESKLNITYKNNTIKNFLFFFYVI